MSRHIATRFVAIAGTAAGLGLTASGKTVVADRPKGTAGGLGIGCNGAELLSAALGGCFWNDLHLVAEAAQVPVEVQHIEAEVELAGKPPRIVRAHVRARIAGAPEETLQEIFEAASETSTVANSLTEAFETVFERL